MKVLGAHAVARPEDGLLSNAVDAHIITGRLGSSFGRQRAYE